MKHQTLSGYVDRLQSRARYTFTRRDAKAALGIKPAALTKALQRLSRAARIKPIRRGFYVIVPLEYSTGGIIPPDWYIDALMKFLGLPYYLGLLSAAAIHGSSHQQAQEYQVVTPEFARPVITRAVRIRFFRNKSMADAAIEKSKTYTGHIPISTPASTAIDLVRFAPRIGGLDAALTVLTELAEKMTADGLLLAAKNEGERSHIQRLGWLLDRAGRRQLTEPMAKWLAKQNPGNPRLDVTSKRGGQVDARWRVIVNANPKSEI